MCESCGGIACKLCSKPLKYIDDDGNKCKKYLCIPCSIVEQILPHSDEKKPLVQDMRAELKGWGFDKAKDLKVHEVEEVWETHVLHRELKKACDKIYFPVFPSSAVTMHENWRSIN